jgi:hypothetical protein
MQPDTPVAVMFHLPKTATRTITKHLTQTPLIILHAHTGMFFFYHRNDRGS